MTVSKHARTFTMAAASLLASVLLAAAAQPLKIDFLLTTNSTGEYVAVACAAKWSLDYKKDLQVVNLNQQDNLKQQDIISAFATGTDTLAGLWAPTQVRISISLPPSMAVDPAVLEPDRH